MFVRTMLAVSVMAIGMTAAVAQQDVVAQRKAAMKTLGAQAGQGAKFIKGEEPFDLAKAQAIFATYAQTAEKAPALFPPDSKGGDTAALPAVWEKHEDFKAKFAKFASDAKDPQSKVKDEASFKATFPVVMRNCGGCHETYRAKKS